MAESNVPSQASRDFSPPTPLQPPELWTWHEVEDLSDLPHSAFSDSKNHEKWEELSVRKAAYICGELGKELPKIFREVSNELGMMTLKGRLISYPEAWVGWVPLEMALCGLFVNQCEQVECVVCGVKFRKLRSRDICHVKRHKQLSPNCLQLKRCQCHGTKETPNGKRIRRNSMSAFHDLRALDNA
ncbi:uncharacterized protein [Littorina saxatilis]|uniref:Uncharacterized protein n=1 Tax=Littorina saxatilis TaxID=31220 RepID=A0AAN9BMJ5_9CAEN